MTVAEHQSQLESRVRRLVREDFTPHFGELDEKFPSIPLWRRLRELGTELWLDTGDVEAIGELWSREMTALTTNNTLLNREVQKGTYDELIARAAELLDEFPELTEQQRKLEFAFILNARHGLKLVEQFDAHVSVEEHTDLAADEEAAVRYAQRFHAVCPERFYVKIPLSPAGLLATRRARMAGVPVNHTLGFSARQNYVIARLAEPAFVNVFMGRLNSFVADNALGDGTNVGEKAMLASQQVIRELREQHGLSTRQIGASLRDGQQVRDLAGLDVMTMPPEVAQDFLDLGLSLEDVTDRTGESYQPPLNEGVDPAAVGLNTLWGVGDDLRECMDALLREELDDFDADRLVDFFAARGCGDVLVRWTDEQVRTSAEEGKIPELENWHDPLAEGAVGLDALMNLAGWNSFNADQKEMDERVRDITA
ncbi:MAG: transaldolase family protein [Candidatus Brocadiia bacterium]